MKNHTIAVNVNVMELIQTLDREDAISLIKAIDLRFAECDFTLEVLRTLVKSLESDMPSDIIRRDIGL